MNDTDTPSPTAAPDAPITAAELDDIESNPFEWSMEECGEYAQQCHEHAEILGGDARFEKLYDYARSLETKLAAYDAAAKDATAVWLNNAVHDYAFYFSSTAEASNKRCAEQISDAIIEAVVARDEAIELNHKWEVFNREKSDKLQSRGLCVNDGSPMVVDEVREHGADMHCPECGYHYSGPSRENKAVSAALRLKRAEAVVNAAQTLEQWLVGKAYLTVSEQGLLDALDVYARNTGGTDGQ